MEKMCTDNSNDGFVQMLDREIIIDVRVRCVIAGCARVCVDGMRCSLCCEMFPYVGIISIGHSKMVSVLWKGVQMAESHRVHL